MTNDLFNVPEGDNRSPVDIALEWLMALNPKPGDVIELATIQKAMGLVDMTTVPHEHLNKWDFARFAVLEQVRDRFEEETGEVLMTNYRGAWRVVPHEEVAASVYVPAYKKALRLLHEAAVRIAQATTEDISSDEHSRRNQATSKIANIRSFMTRETRKRLAD